MAYMLEEKAQICAKINLREKILKWEQTDFSDLDKINK